MQKKKVLIIRLSSLGDVIFNLPLASVFKNNNYEVTWVTSEKGFDVLDKNPLVDDVVLIPTKKWKKQSFAKTFREYLQILKYLRAKRFDIAIDTQLLFKSFIWLAFSGAKRRIVSKSAREFSFLGGNEIIEELNTDSKSHAIKNYLKFAKYLGFSTDNFSVELPLSEISVVEKISDLLKDLDSTKPLVVISPVTTWAPKHWDKNNWKTLIQRISNDYNIVLTGMKSDAEYLEYISTKECLNLAGKTNVKELIELYRRTDLLISLDSGSTHLAWATGVPKIVTIFCCTPKELYAPIGSADKYIALSGNLDCQFCHKRICPLKTGQNACTVNPAVEEVLSAINSLIGVKFK